MHVNETLHRLLNIALTNLTKSLSQNKAEMKLADVQQLLTIVKTANIIVKDLDSKNNLSEELDNDEKSYLEALNQLSIKS